jgi:conjugal transfer mating pair stabilization protein TraN
MRITLPPGLSLVAIDDWETYMSRNYGNGDGGCENDYCTGDNYFHEVFSIITTGEKICPLGDYPCVDVNGKKMCSRNSCVNMGTGDNIEDISADNSSYQDDGARDADGVCLGQIYIFNGKGYQCRTSGVQTFFKNCCSSGIAMKNQGKILLIIPQCNINDAETVLRKDAGVCHYVGKFCSKKLKFPGSSICLQHKKSYCCFHSKLGRIIQEQGRPQLKSFNCSGSWGDPKSPNCRGLTPEEFQMIDFDKVNLSEYFGEIAEQIQGKAAQIQQTEQEKISNFYQQTTGGN